MLGGRGELVCGGRHVELEPRDRACCSAPGARYELDNADRRRTSSSCRCRCTTRCAAPRRAPTRPLSRLADARRRRRPPIARSGSSSTPSSGCATRDAVRRLHPGRRRAAPLSPLRGGDLRARRARRHAHERRADAAAPRHRASTCRRVQLHTLENSGPGVMRVFGVFRPAGSPAAAFYPDGTPAYSADEPQTAAATR